MISPPNVLLTPSGPSHSPTPPCCLCPRPPDSEPSLTRLPYCGHPTNRQIPWVPSQRAPNHPTSHHPHFSHPDLSCFHFLHPTLYLVILCLQEVDRVSFFSPQNPFYFRMILDLEKLQRLYRDFPYILCPTSLMFTSYTMTAHLSKRRN